MPSVRIPQPATRFPVFCRRASLLPAAVILALAVPGRAEAQELNKTGKWTPLPSASWEHIPVHVALLPGDASHHSKILSWEFKAGRTAKLWGWNPSDHDCSTYPAAQFDTLALDRNVPRIFCSGHSGLGGTGGELLIAGGTEGSEQTQFDQVGLRQSILFRSNPGPGEPQWSPQGSMNAGRYYPTSTTLPDGKALVFSGEQFWHAVIFGGTTAPQDPVSATRDDINRLGLNTDGQWMPAIAKPANPSIPWPEPREGHTAVGLEKLQLMMVFGGRGSGAPILLNDSWQLQVIDTTGGYEYRWLNTSPPLNERPAPRTRHSAVVRIVGASDNRMMVYGGRGTSSQPLSDVWEFTKVLGVWRWTDLTGTITGTSPGSRYGHAAIYDQKHDRLLIFGGLTDDNTFADDKLYALSLSSMTWSELSPGPGPLPREGHSIVVDPALRTGGPPNFTGNQRRAVLFGGGSSQELKNDVWELWIHETTGAVQWREVAPAVGPQGAPLPRSRHAATWDETRYSFSNAQYNRMVVYGGSTGTGANAETWALRWGGTSWSWLPLETQPSVSLAGHSAVFLSDTLWAIDPELFTPSGGSSPGSWGAQNKPRKQSYYPYMFVLPSGNLFYAGSSGAPNDAPPALHASFLFRRSGTPAWQPLPAEGVGLDAWAAVGYRPGEIMKCGQYLGAILRNGRTQRIQIGPTDNAAGWIESENQMRASVYHNLTVLPTGEVLVTGGLERPDFDGNEQFNPSVRQAQLWNPDSDDPAVAGVGRWGIQLAADPARRGYHSTALLLPDGRVLSAGGESATTNADYFDRVTIFCPPYLFADASGTPATRPTIAGGPDTVSYGRRFTICTPEAATISKACLMRPGSVTHTFDGNQRYVPLTILDRCNGHLIVDGPANANLAPPGYYLLFVLNSGVPSVAQWVRATAAQGLDTCDGIAPAAVSDVTVATGVLSAAVSWTAPGDDGNCGTAQEFELRHSSSPISDGNFTSATRVDPGLVPPPGPPGTLHCVELNLACGLYYFAVKTRDDRYHWSSISNVPGGSVQCSGSQMAVCSGGEGLMAQGWGEGGWAAENSLLWESPLGATDLYRVQGKAGPVEAQYRGRLVKVGAGHADVDQVSLGTVDHDPGLRAFSGPDRVFLGTAAAVARVTDDSGADVTALVDGSNERPYAGEPGRSLLVELGGRGSSNVALVVESAGYTAGVSPDSSGILVQKPEGGGGWRTIAQLHPRRTFAQHAVDAEGSGTLRLLLLREHSVRSLERLAVTRTENPELLDLARAEHSRLGDVAGAVRSSGGTSTILLPGEHLALSFGVTEVPAGQVRDLFLFARGGYTALGAPSSPTSGEGAGAPGLGQSFASDTRATGPNPTTGEIRISYTLARAAEVALRVYDMAGRLVRSLAGGWQAAGLHEVLWDGRDEGGVRVPPGVYFCRITPEGTRGQGKLVVLAR